MAWGDNHEGQLGNGTIKTSAVPVPVPGLTGVTAIAAGSLFSLALLNNGTVMAWGDNREGQLGDGTLRNSTVPVPVKGLSGVTAITAGAQHSLAALANGTAMAWGDNELGNSASAARSACGWSRRRSPRSPGSRMSRRGRSTRWPCCRTVRSGSGGRRVPARPAQRIPRGIGQSNVPLRVPGLGKAKAIAAGGSFSLAVVAGGRVRGWGDNAFGQLGNGSAQTGPALVTVTGLSGAAHVVAGGVTALAFGPAARGGPRRGGTRPPWRARSRAPGGPRATRRTRVASTA